MLYEEAREQLRGGRYPVDPPEAAELGGLSCRLRLGPFEPGRHTELSLRSAPAGPCPRDPHPRQPPRLLWDPTLGNPPRPPHLGPTHGTPPSTWDTTMGPPTCGIHLGPPHPMGPPPPDHTGPPDPHVPPVSLVTPV